MCGSKRRVHWNAILLKQQNIISKQKFCLSKMKCVCYTSVTAKWMSVLVIYMTPNHNTEICASWNDYSRLDVAVTTRRINANSVQLVKLRYQRNFSRSSICTASCYPARVSITSDTGGNLIHAVSEARKAGCCAAVCLLSCPFHGIGCIYTHAREDLHMQHNAKCQMHKCTHQYVRS